MRNGKRGVPGRVKGSAAAPTPASSVNVFTDLRLPNPEIALAKAALVQRIRELVIERKLTQAETGALLGLDQPKVSALVRGQVDGYSLDRLFRFLNALGQEIEITVRGGKAAERAVDPPGVFVRGSGPRR